jgi:hypothetical protein
LAILPIALRGGSSSMWVVRGTLKRASDARQCSKNGPRGARRAVRVALGEPADGIDDEQHERLRPTVRVFLSIGGSYTATADPAGVRSTTTGSAFGSRASSAARTCAGLRRRDPYGAAITVTLRQARPGRRSRFRSAPVVDPQPADLCGRLDRGGLHVVRARAFSRRGQDTRRRTLGAPRPSRRAAPDARVPLPRFHGRTTGRATCSPSRPAAPATSFLRRSRRTSRRRRSEPSSAGRRRPASRRRR